MKFRVHNIEITIHSTGGAKKVIGFKKHVCLEEKEKEKYCDVRKGFCIKTYWFALNWPGKAGVFIEFKTRKAYTLLYPCGVVIKKISFPAV